MSYVFVQNAFNLEAFPRHVKVSANIFFKYKLDLKMFMLDAWNLVISFHINSPYSCWENLQNSDTHYSFSQSIHKHLLSPYYVFLFSSLGINYWGRFSFVRKENSRNSILEWTLRCCHPASYLMHEPLLQLPSPQWYLSWSLLVRGLTTSLGFLLELWTSFILKIMSLYCIEIFSVAST